MHCIALRRRKARDIVKLFERFSSPSSYKYKAELTLLAWLRTELVYPSEDGHSFQ